MSSARRATHALAPVLASVLVAALGGALAACGSDEPAATAPELPEQLCDVVTTTPVPRWTWTVDDQSTGGDDALRTATCSMSDAAGSTVVVRLDSYGDADGVSASARASEAYDDACDKLTADASGTPTRDERTCQLEPSGLPADQAAVNGVFRLRSLPGLATVDVQTTAPRRDDARFLVSSVRLSVLAALD